MKPSPSRVGTIARAFISPKIGAGGSFRLGQVPVPDSLKAGHQRPAPAKRGSPAFRLFRLPGSLKPALRAAAAAHKNAVAHAFSLVELLVVITILVILTALGIPAVSSIRGSNRLTITEQIIVAQLNLARQTALTENVPVQVRFYSYPGEGGTPKAIRAVQIFKLKADGSYKAVTPIQRFPQSIVALDSLGAASAATDPSTILVNARASSSVAGDSDLSDAQAGTYDLASFDFRPDGSTTFDSAGFWHVTIAASPLPASGLPKNFATIQIDPLNGTTRTFRP